jgi:hypothetical protein
MFTRKQYWDGECSHDAYYTEIAREVGMAFTRTEDVERFCKAMQRDENLSTISFKWWEAQAVSLRAYSSNLAKVLSDRGDEWSLGTGVCIAKAAARAAVRGSGA